MAWKERQLDTPEQVRYVSVKSCRGRIISCKMRSAAVSSDTAAIMKKFINIYRIAISFKQLYLTNKI